MSTSLARSRRAGFTLLELILALCIGLVVLTTATALTAATWQSVRGSVIREDVTRNARYIGVTLQRDIQETGVDLASSVDFGTLAVWNDTIAILRVPYAPAAPGQYPLSQANFPNGVCGQACLDIQTGGAVPELSVGDLARVQVNNVRRLIYVTAVNPVNGGYRVQFANTATLLQHGAGIQGLAINPANAFIQRLGVAVYWRENGRLLRATVLNPDLSLRAEAVATGVQTLTARLIFTDGSEAARADDGSDGNANNDYDDITALRVQVMLQGERTDPRVNGGRPVQRLLQWWFAPRNLTYDRNRG
ncbi:MAG TPA: prepilin-type N-terminal cleavage/methylation domain-containing protein [Gemmatimonadales bacterium]|jgi:prepilin-type N-terminal cleavage/methylation domain-containing protein